MNWILVLAFLTYYIIYPGGKKNWEKRTKEIDAFIASKNEAEVEYLNY